MRGAGAGGPREQVGGTAGAVKFGYDRAGLPNTGVGTFPQTLYDEAQKKGWIVISMRNDWKRIFGFEGMASR
jgi:hypothetical protein